MWDCEAYLEPCLCNLVRVLESVKFIWVCTPTKLIWELPHVRLIRLHTFVKPMYARLIHLGTYNYVCKLRPICFIVVLTYITLSIHFHLHTRPVIERNWKYPDILSYFSFLSFAVENLFGGFATIKFWL